MTFSHSERAELQAHKVEQHRRSQLKASEFILLGAGKYDMRY